MEVLLVVVQSQCKFYLISLQSRTVLHQPKPLHAMQRLG